jgi:hypothetical protein
MLDISILKEFLVKAKKSTYASEDKAQKVKENDKSTTLIFEEGDYKYHDNYFGGEPYGGREVVFFQCKPIYLMTYYGWVDEKIKDAGEVYRILQKALSLIPKEYPYRGPAEFIEDTYKYVNEYIGDVDNFSGKEFIEYEGKIIYQAKYVGGLVDQR